MVIPIVQSWCVLSGVTGNSSSYILLSIAVCRRGLGGYKLFQNLELWGSLGGVACGMILWRRLLVIDDVTFDERLWRNGQQVGIVPLG